jgi:predicted DNA-binding transcriptional regulator AlpA
MNREELHALPAVVDVPTAAQALGLSKTAAYELIRCGGWPTPVFRLGKLIRIPTAPLLALLGIPPEHVEDSRSHSTSVPS